MEQHTIQALGRQAQHAGEPHTKDSSKGVRVCLPASCQASDLRVKCCLFCGAVQILYDLRNSDAASLAAVNKLFKQRMLECESVLYPGSSYGGAAITTTPTVYG